MKVRLAFAGWVFFLLLFARPARADPCSAPFDALADVRRARRMVGEALVLDANIEEEHALMRTFAPSKRIRVQAGFAMKLQSIFGFTACTAEGARSAELTLGSFGPFAGFETPDGEWALRIGWMARTEDVELDTPKGAPHVSGPGYAKEALVVSGRATRWFGVMAGYVGGESVRSAHSPVLGFQPMQDPQASWFGVVRVPAISVAATFVGSERSGGLEWFGFDVSRLRIPRTDFYATLGAGAIPSEQQALWHAGLAYRRAIAHSISIDVAADALVESNPPRVRQIAARVELPWEFGRIATPTSDLIPAEMGFWFKIAPFVEISTFGSRWLDATGAASSFVPGGAGGLVMRAGAHGFSVGSTFSVGMNRPTTLALFAGAIDHAEWRGDMNISWAF